MCKVCEAVEKTRIKRGNSDGYIPVPVWDGKEWLPVSYVAPVSDQVMCWPEGFDVATIPRPHYQLLDIVEFEWSGKIITGYVQHVKIHGGSFMAHEGPALNVCRKRYRRNKMKAKS